MRFLMLCYGMKRSSVVGREGSVHLGGPFTAIRDFEMLRNQCLLLHEEILSRRYLPHGNGQRFKLFRDKLAKCGGGRSIKCTASSFLVIRRIQIIRSLGMAMYFR